MNDAVSARGDETLDSLILLLRRLDSLVVETSKISSKILWDGAPRDLAAEFLLGDGFRQISELRMGLFDYLAQRIGEERLLDMFD